MSAKWETVTEEEARQHKLYGVKGWLLVFGIGMSLAFFRDLGDINSEARDAGATLGEFLAYDHPAITFVKAALAYEAFMAIAVIGMMVAKASFFRIAALGLMLSLVPVLGVVAAATGAREATAAVAQALVPWAVSCAVWGTYLFRSQRVRVTFEHKVKRGGDKPAASGGADGAPAAPAASAADAQDEQRAGAAPRG